MHESVLCCYNPTDLAMVIINTVSKIKQGFSNRQINGAEQKQLCTPNLGIHQLNISSGLLKSKKS